MSNPTSVITEQRLSEFYQGILPYLGGSADAGFTPVGTIIMMSGNEAPANYLACDGTVYNISDYPELANFYKRSQGSANFYGGNGTTTFAVPDLRGEFIRGTGTNSHTDGGNGGSVGVHQGATTIPNIGVEANASKIMFHNNATAEYIVNGDKAVKSSTKGSDITASTSWSTTTQSSFYIRPTNTSVLFCVATKNIYLNPAMDYSTSEKVVGTWIDGKTLYQKTIPNVTTAQCVTEGTEVAKTDNLSDFGITNVDTIFITNCFLLSENKNVSVPVLSFCMTSDADSHIRVAVSKTSFMSYNSNTAFNNRTLTVTIQYTKTT